MKKVKKCLYLTSLLALSPITSAIGASINEINYEYKFPYDNAGELKVSNDTNKKITIKQIDFDVNVNISGTPYGNLYAYDMMIQQQPNAANTSVHYSFVSSGKGVEINSHETKSMTYIYSSAMGVFSALGMDPERVQLTLSTGEKVNLPVRGHCQGNECNNPSPNYKIMGYYADWAQYARKYNATDIPTAKLNTIIYAFLGYDKTGAVRLLDPWADANQIPAISQLRKKFPYLDASLSFGGWTLSSMFSDLAADVNAREQFAKNAVKAMKQANFNGVDIDWEFPVANGAPGEPHYETSRDANNYVALLQSLRNELDRQGALDKTHYNLTIAVGAGIDKIDAMEKASAGSWKKIAGLIDHLNLMTYDFHGSFDGSQAAPYNVSDFMSAMALDPKLDPTANKFPVSEYNDTAAVAAYQKVGFNGKQIVLGVPMYGRMSNISEIGDTYGLYQTITGTPSGEFDDSQSGATGMFDYKCIVDNSLCYGASASYLSGMTLVDFTKNALGDYAKTPWGYNSSKKQFITYDDEKSMEYKANYVKENKLGGVMFWELDGDMPAQSPKSILSKAQSVLAK